MSLSFVRDAPLSSKYPTFWADSPETIAIIDALGGEANDLRAALEDLIAQCDINTATWGLSYWERQVGIDVDVSKDPAYRRTRIISKLRGTGTVTVAMIQNVAESFANGDVEVIEDAQNYHFDIKFVGRMGIPPNMDDLTATIEEIKPAHLTYGYIYVYRTWAVVAPMTWAQTALYTWQHLKEGEIA